MPPKEITLRSQQLSLLRQIGHKMSTDPEIGKVLEKIVGHPEYDILMGIKRETCI